MEHIRMISRNLFSLFKSNCCVILINFFFTHPHTSVVRRGGIWLRKSPREKRLSFRQVGTAAGECWKCLLIDTRSVPASQPKPYHERKYLRFHHKLSPPISAFSERDEKQWSLAYQICCKGLKWKALPMSFNCLWTSNYTDTWHWRVQRSERGELCNLRD